MVTVYAAIYPEVSFLIKRYGLKKDGNTGKFQMFSNDGLRVVITGVGSIAAATAVGFVSGLFPVGQQDVMVNLGCCALVGEAEYLDVDGRECVGEAECLDGRGYVGEAECLDSRECVSEAKCLGYQELGEAKAEYKGKKKDSNKEHVGTWYRVNKITELATGRTFYPDILKKHSFAEKEIVTGVKVYRGRETSLSDEGEFQKNESVLYDMEAASFYQAGSCFYAPHRMIFLKMVSDFGISQEDGKGEFVSEKNLTEEKGIAWLEELMGKEAAPVFSLMEELLEQQRKKMAGKLEQSKNCLDMERLGNDLHCSVTMEAELKQLLLYCELSSEDWKTMVRQDYSEGLLPCKSKKEGKLYLDRLRERLL